MIYLIKHDVEIKMLAPTKRMVTMARYRVEMKKFKDGSWYTKTETEHLGAAISVAHNHSQGREYNVIDNVTGDIIEHGDEDASMKEFITSKEGYDTFHLW